MISVAYEINKECSKQFDDVQSKEPIDSISKNSINY